ncbi:mpv17-like protein [Bacillus rossius redtenbacheri]|uniref:mpv17-like protein n=1 Tax=Bacillus rossius redtenbacheri TaxID=93214 RepID=UPI002FDD594F
MSGVLSRGMLLYAALWPASSLCQQALARADRLDWRQAARYGVYGCFVVVPMLHVWLRLSSYWFPQMNLRTALLKVVIEQMSYGPLALACFLGGMSLLEGGSVDDAVAELRSKFFSTWKVGVCVWPAVQTVNFTFVPERNRLLFVGTCSFLWTVFIAYVKQTRVEGGPEPGLRPTSSP